MATDEGPKTVENDDDVAAFVASVADPGRQADARTLLELMGRVTGQPAKMWGTSIVGFGRYHYRYESGREGDMAAAAFSPRKAATSVYFMDGFDGHGDLLARLGPHRHGAGCLYVTCLDEVDLGVLEQMVHRSYARLTSGTFGTRLS